MRYSKAALVGRDWHKVIVHLPLHGCTTALSDKVKAATRRCTGDVMHMSGGHWHLLMIDTESDLVFLKLMLGFTDEDYRGCGDWSKMKYSCAAKNRIPNARSV